MPTRVQALPSAEPRAGSPLRQVTPWHPWKVGCRVWIPHLLCASDPPLRASPSQSRVAVPTGQSPPDEDGRECMWRWRVATSPQEDAFGRLLPCILPACCARAIAVAVGPGTPASVSSVHRAVWITCLAAAATLRDMGAQGWPAPLHRMHRPRGSRAHLHFDPLSSAPLGTTRVRVCNSFHPPLSSPPARDAEDPRHQGGGSRSTAVAIPGKDKPSAPLDVSLGASTIVVGSAGPSSSLGTQPCASPPGPRDWQPSSSHVALWVSRGLASALRVPFPLRNRHLLRQHRCKTMLLGCPCRAARTSSGTPRRHRRDMHVKQSSGVICGRASSRRLAGPRLARFLTKRGA